MCKKSSNSPQQKSVKDKKSTMQKFRFSKKFGYMDVLVVCWGLTIGLTYFGLLTLNTGTTELDKLIDCKMEDCRESSTLSPLIPALKKLLDHAKDGKKICSLACTLLIIEFTYVGILSTCNFIAVRERLATGPKPGTCKTMALIRICKTSGFVLLAVDFVGLMLGYPDMTICTFLFLFFVLLFCVFLNILYVESIYNGIQNNEEEERIMEEEAKALEHASADQIETI